MFSKNQSGSSLNRQLFETYMALDNWHQFRLRLFIEGIFVGIAGGLSISLFRFLLNESEDLRIHLYYACLIQRFTGMTSCHFFLTRSFSLRSAARSAPCAATPPWPAAPASRR